MVITAEPKLQERIYAYKVAIRALREGRDNNPAHKETFNSLIADLKKENRIGSQLMVMVQLQHACMEKWRILCQ